MSAQGVLEVRHDAECLDEPGFWVVVIPFAGTPTFVRMERIAPTTLTLLPTADGEIAPSTVAKTVSVEEPGWESSLDEVAYQAGVVAIRDRIAAGEVYQVNLCRVLSRPIGDDASLDRLADLLSRHHRTRFSARISLPSAGLDIACASPELYLERAGDVIRSGPIKGTATSLDAMLPKDFTENVMITDLVRNDLSTVCLPGTVTVLQLCHPEHYPGSVHLVSNVAGRLRPGTTWPRILEIGFPPGSVSGAPKSTALQAIRDLEPIPRGPYCGAIGYVDNASRTARLAVGIRTFWADGGAGRRRLHLGTGAGITWASDPQGEWAETQLKAGRLLRLAEQAIDARAVEMRG
nr:chorismate-binding protein [Flexivirga meconopsidis]